MSTKVDHNVPDDHYVAELAGLPGHPKTAAGLEGRDPLTGEVWRAAIEPDPQNPYRALPILVPMRFSLLRIVTAEEYVEELAEEWGGHLPSPAG